MKGICYFILFCLFAFLQTKMLAQNSADTLSIDNILIQATRENFLSKDNNNYKIDSTVIRYYTQSSIADLLQYFTPIQINQNSPGGVASLSVRGTADDQSNIFWNGVKLNSLSLGAVDVSLIPINIVQKIEVVTNSSGSTLGSGNFGAAILLNTQPSYQQQTNVLIKQTFGSFKNYKTDFIFSKSNTNLYFSSSSSYQQITNNFPYYDRYKINNPLVRQSSNKSQQWTTTNELHIKLKKQQNFALGNFSFGKNYHIPTIMGSYAISKKYQKDIGAKSFLNYQKIFKQGKLAIRNTYAYDYLLYSDSTTNLVSKFQMHQLLHGINYIHQFRKYFSLDVGTDYNFNFANIKAYGKKVAQHKFALFAGTKIAIRQFNLNISVRQEVINYQYIRPQFFVSTDYTNKKNFYSTTLSYSDKFRYPDLNDLYWIPGGNINLSPEFGYTTEWQNNFILNKNKQQLKYSISIYFMRIKDNIMWNPMESGLFSPINIKKTQHYGAENTLQYTLHIKQNIFFKISSNYNYNKSSIVEDANNISAKGNKIRYKPQHTFKSNFIFNYTYFDFGTNYLYISKRYTDDDNIDIFSLPAYHILDMFFAVKYSKKTYNATLVFKISNILNTSYESIRAYAQPLRNYQFSFIFNFKSRQS